MKILKFLMFNRFVRLYLNSDFYFLQWNKRIKSTILEMWYTLSIFFPFFIILIIPIFFIGNANQTNFVWTDFLLSIPFSLMMIILINKDIFGGQSPVHRLLGLQVVDAKTNEKATKVKCILRNITAPLWPIEAIFLLANPKRRLGDLIAGTSLIEVKPSDPELILTEIEDFKFDNQAKLTFMITVILIIIFVIFSHQRLKPW
ncbi:hypothetical protein A5893_17400 [Pedobacter psychrophilus]|uniref:RDD domain-containing protein n=1 Tax=Pedobacter psychrophilus TaxID=1826909 RepID=A0A179DIV2_9SPHI|nr:RDD family protein [Pedobacter psychrophilus]OAQ41017.1 hypothetical protein A5893_17400 [Pedobacter psychrophilus]